LKISSRASNNTENYKKISLKFRKFKRFWFLYLLMIPGLLHLIIFRYIPMTGIILAFKKYTIRGGVYNSPWIGFDNFMEVFNDMTFMKVVLRNTVIINIYHLIFGFTFTIFLALMLNEITSNKTKRIFQTAVYFPHFVSWVVMAGLVTSALSPSHGLVNEIIKALGGEEIYFLLKKEYFRSILVISSIVKSSGYGTILYFAAIMGINPSLYESAVIDGANRFHKIRYITLPRIKPVIILMLVFSIAGIFNSNFEQVQSLYNPVLYETGDVLSTYMYRTGITQGRYEFATAQGLIFNVIGLGLLYITDRASKRLDVMGIF
jgi:putative aldouronate transport system permease protein